MYSDEIVLRIFGDICSDRSLDLLFKNSEIHELFGFTLKYISMSDIAIANLECPLTSELNPIKKTGPCLAGPPETANVLFNAGFNAVSLANNHIMDQGSKGLTTTIDNCKLAGLHTVGAGINIESARSPLVMNIKGLRVGFYSMAEAEFSIASEETCGANGIDAINWIPDLQKLRRVSDYIVILLHAGKERYQFPSPRTQRLARSLVDNGANMVVCQHSHCIGAIEKYKDCVIVYGQGNYLFAGEGNETKSWNQGFIIDAKIGRRTTYSFNKIYFKQSDEEPRIRELSASELKIVIDQQTRIDSVINSSDFIRNEWQNLADKEVPLFLYNLGGFGGLLCRILRKFQVYKILYKGLTRITALNLIRCETHRELLETFFEANSTKRDS